MFFVASDLVGDGPRAGPQWMAELRFRALWPYPRTGFTAQVGWMVWYFRVVENEDRSWVCRHGRMVFDEHLTLGDAIDHTDVLAAAHPPAEVMIHRLDGSVENLGAPPETGKGSPGISLLI